LEHFKVKPYEMAEAPSPWRKVLEREVGRLSRRDDVLAVGLCGSVSYGDLWPGADLDIEIVLRGDKPRKIVTTEQEISVDYGYFGETVIKDIPYETRPIYDPKMVLTNELASRVKSLVLRNAMEDSLVRARTYLARSNAALPRDPFSALAWATIVSWPLAEVFTLASGEYRTHRRVVSRLEKSMNKIGERDLFQKYCTLLGFPQTLTRAHDLLSELQLGYREIWSHFRGKPDGPVYMVQQPDSEAWFKNRILPLYEYDKRDLVNLVYEEFLFILSFVFRTSGYERSPDAVLLEALKFNGPPSQWTARYQNILKFFPAHAVSEVLHCGEELLGQAELMAEATTKSSNHS
jgi:predicted nucleotidyltransferase